MAGCCTDEDLLQRYLSPAMAQYFARKLPDLDQDELRVRIAECLKALVLMNPGPVLFSEDIDTIWHYWIMQTDQYAQLCADLPGGGFRHHSSNDYPGGEPDAADKAGEGDRVVGHFVSYVAVFGAIEPDRLRFWPPLASLMESLGWDLPRMNAFLQERSLQFEIALGQLQTLSGTGLSVAAPDLGGR
jgi:hypothetical protein